MLGSTLAFCDIDFDDIEEIATAIKDCLATTKFKLPEVETAAAVKKFLDDFEKGGFDDKCFSKCVAEKIKIMKNNKPDLTLLMPKLKAANATAESLSNFEKTWKTCEDSMDKGQTDVCKYMASFSNCVTMGLLPKPK